MLGDAVPHRVHWPPNACVTLGSRWGEETLSTAPPRAQRPHHDRQASLTAAQVRQQPSGAL
jgi:hypothetical protein